MKEYYEQVLFDNTRRLLREIREIKADFGYSTQDIFGYSTQDILLAMIASAIITKPLPVPIKKD